ncbi:MAG TPA: dienelactone hydrolase family protein [Opitutus sp.]|nr:dienelactone hydrolase family protein [Opitutus sp.]
MKRLLLSLALILTAGAAHAQPWAEARIETSPRHLEWVTVKHDGREVGCYVGYPEVKTRAPAVLVIHEIFGLSDWARLLVDELAAAGYVAIAPDLLWGAGEHGGGTAEIPAREIGQRIWKLPPEQITADLNAALDYIRHDVACDGNVVVMGFCWGGGQSFRFATNSDAIKAAFVFYGPAPDAADMARITAPVHGFYGGNDARISAGVPVAAEAMKAAGKSFEPVIYDGAGHGFMRAGDAPPPESVAAPAADAGEDAKKAYADYEKQLAAYAANVKAHDAAWERIKAVMARIP